MQSGKIQLQNTVWQNTVWKNTVWKKYRNEGREMRETCCPSHFQIFTVSVSLAFKSIRRRQDVIYFLKAMTNSFQIYDLQAVLFEVYPAFASSKLCKFT